MHTRFQGPHLHVSLTENAIPRRSSHENARRITKLAHDYRLPTTDYRLPTTMFPALSKTDRAAKRDGLERGNEVRRRLGAAEQQKPARVQHLADLFENRFFGGHIEIDQHVAHENQLNSRQTLPGLDQVDL